MNPGIGCMRDVFDRSAIRANQKPSMIAMHDEVRGILLLGNDRYAISRPSRGCRVHNKPSIL